MSVYLSLMLQPHYTIVLTNEQLMTLVKLGQEDQDLNGDHILEISEIAEAALHSESICSN